MKVRDFIHGRLVVIDADDQLGRAARLMLSHGIRHLPVLDNGQLVGVLSERDLVAFHGAGGMRAPVSAAMTTPVRTVSGDDDVAEAARRLMSETIGCLPVVDGARLIGIVTTTDFLAERAHIVPVRRIDRVVDLMTTDPAVAHPDELLVDALAEMSTAGVRHLPVVDGDNRVVGMLSDRDIRSVMGDPRFLESEVGEPEQRAALRRVRDVASMRPVVIRWDAPVADAAARLVDDRIGALAVVDEGGRLVGILSYVDLLRRLAEMERAEAARADAETAAPAP